MAGVWKVVVGKRVIATCDEPEAAACLVGNIYGEGSQIKVDGRIVWREGSEAINAVDSYDEAAATMMMRRREHARQARARYDEATRLHLESLREADLFREGQNRGGDRALGERV